MKSARIAIFRNDRKQPGSKQPDGSGLIELPAQFIAELAQLLQTGQFTGTNQQGEPIVTMRASVWRSDGSNTLILSGQIESPSERAAYLATQQQAAPQQAWGQPPAQPAWGAPPQQPPTQQWGAPPQSAPQQWGLPAQAPQMPMQQPAQPMPTDQPMI